MPKRSRSSSPESDLRDNNNAGPSSSKRQLMSQLLDTKTDVSENKRSIADLFPFQEIFLRILSFLSPNELANIQSVNRYWGKMSLDPQLWKRLYLDRYPHPHYSRLLYNNASTSEVLQNDTGASPRTPKPLRPIARLPSRAFPPPSPKRSPSIAEGQLTPTSVTTFTSKDGAKKGKQTEKEADIEFGHGIRNDGVDWKMMLRLGTNWSNGNVLSQTTIPLPPSPSPSITSDTHFSALPTLELSPSLSSHQSYHRNAGVSEQFIALSPSYIFISSPLSPLVQVHSSLSASNVPIGMIPPPPGWSNPKRPDNVTCIVSDQSVLPLKDEVTGDKLPTRIAIFYQSGGFVILLISPNSDGIGITWKREFINPPNNRPPSNKRRTYEMVQGDPVVLASLHQPILISCTRDFNLSVYLLSTSTTTSCENNKIPKPRHLQTLKSQVSFHPAILTLFPAGPPTPSNRSIDDYQARKDEIQEIENFKISLTYCTPLYPSSWTIAVQEFSIDLSSSYDLVNRGESFHVGRNDEDDEMIWPRKLRPIAGVKRKAVGIGSDGRWCILVGERDNKIQVYSLPHTQIDQPINNSFEFLQVESNVKGKDIADQPIIHCQTLTSKYHSDITSLSLNSGRCVSSNRDGKLLIWELDDEEADEKMGRTIGYVEVKQGGRRSIWKGATGPQIPTDHSNEDSEQVEGVDIGARRSLPHPQSISSAARSLFLPQPPLDIANIQHREGENKPPIKYLTFDEQKIVGVVNTGGQDEVMKIWSFS